MTGVQGQVVSFLSDPNNFLYSLDLQKGLFEFVTTTRSELSNYAFLDNRTLGLKFQKVTIPAHQIIPALQEIEFHLNRNKSNYLFHTSFCCSTLLARCLDFQGKNLSLKEPFALLGLYAFKRLSVNFDPAGPNWKNLRDITLYLLSRSFQKGEKILFKPSNGVNNILPEILACPRTERVLLLYGDLESFLISVLRGGKQRVASVAQILEDLVIDFSDNLPLKAEQIRNLNDVQQMALVWGMQMQFFKQTLALNNNQKVKSLKSADFLQSPGKTLEKLNAFYDLGFTEEDRKGILNGPVFNSHSKNTGTIFSKSQHLIEKENVLKIFGEDIRETLTWANSLGFGYKDGLSNPL